jgi:hypothetical protein
MTSLVGRLSFLEFKEFLYLPQGGTTENHGFPRGEIAKLNDSRIPHFDSPLVLLGARSVQALIVF